MATSEAVNGKCRLEANRLRFTALVVRNWLKRVGVKTLFIEPGSPWEDGYVESFNSKLGDSALGYRPPAPEKLLVGAAAAGCATLGPRSAPRAAGQDCMVH